MDYTIGLPGVQTGEEIIYTSPLLLPLNHYLHQQFEGGSVSVRSLPPPNWPLHELAFWEASNQRFELHFFQRTNEVFLVPCTLILLSDQVTQFKIGKRNMHAACSAISASGHDGHCDEGNRCKAKCMKSICRQWLHEHEVQILPPAPLRPAAQAPGADRGQNDRFPLAVWLNTQWNTNFSV